MMKAKPGRFLLAVTAMCGLLLASGQSANAFELFARLSGDSAAQKCDACQKGSGASQKGACQKGACQKGGDACQKGGCDKGACQKGATQKGGCEKGACQKAPRQKLWGAHQKGGKGKGKDSVGTYGESLGNTPYVGAPVPPPIFSLRGA